MFLFFFTLFPFLVLFFFFECTYTMFLVSFGCRWYGMVYHSSLVPYLDPYGPVLYYREHNFVLDCFLQSRCVFVTACFVTTGKG